MTSCSRDNNWFFPLIGKIYRTINVQINHVVGWPTIVIYGSWLPWPRPMLDCVTDLRNNKRR
jgi:hypothetical protein